MTREHVVRPRRGALLALALVSALVPIGCSAESARRSAPPATGTTTTLRPETLATASIDDIDAAPTIDTVARSRSRRLELRTISTRADTVTGGDVLVGVRVTDGTSLDRLVLQRDGVDVSAAVRTAPDGEGVVALVGGVDRFARITASLGRDRAELVVVNHPASGPLLADSGSAADRCVTEDLGLGTPSGPDCDVPTSLSWTYRSTDGTWKPLTSVVGRPDDVSTTTVDGRTVPVVVRVETGVSDRGVYQIAVLDPEPGRGWSPTGWNRHVVVRVDGSCGAPVDRVTTPGVLDEELLVGGYLVAGSTALDGRRGCGPGATAEPALVLREHIAEGYGPPDAVVAVATGDGGSRALLVVQAYPGVFDAVVADEAVPDAPSRAADAADCAALAAAWQGPLGAQFDAARRAAVEGRDVGTPCVTTGSAIAPDVSGNEGILYGLEAFEQGAIDGEKFVALNEAVVRLSVEAGAVATSGVHGLLLHAADAGSAGRVPAVLGVRGSSGSPGAIGARLGDTLTTWTTVPDATTSAAVGTAIAWLDAARADPGSTWPERLAHQRPAPLAGRVVGRGLVRLAAGAPPTTPPVGCARRPLEAVGTLSRLTADQLDRLRRALPNGMCDWELTAGGLPAVELWRLDPAR